MALSIKMGPHCQDDCEATAVSRHDVIDVASPVNINSNSLMNIIFFLSFRCNLQYKSHRSIVVQHRRARRISLFQDCINHIILSHYLLTLHGDLSSLPHCLEATSQSKSRFTVYLYLFTNPITIGTFCADVP